MSPPFYTRTRSAGGETTERPLSPVRLKTEGHVTEVSEVFPLDRLDGVLGNIIVTDVTVLLLLVLLVVLHGFLGPSVRKVSIGSQGPHRDSFRELWRKNYGTTSRPV